jgi:hypothetical protein
MQGKDVGGFVLDQFHAELESRRQLLVSPPGVELSTAGRASRARPGAGRLDTQPTARLGPSDHTVPDAPRAVSGELAVPDAPGVALGDALADAIADLGDAGDTRVETAIWSRTEVTSVDLGFGADAIIDAESLPASDAACGTAPPSHDPEDEQDQEP